MVKKPEPAPDKDPDSESLRELLRLISDGAFAETIRRANEDYLYWDKFKYSPLPGGVSPEDGWYLLKTARALNRRPTPIIDVHGHPILVFVD